MKKTIGEIKFNEFYLTYEGCCKCTYTEDYFGEPGEKLCPLNCPLRDKDTEQCLLDLFSERRRIDNQIKKFENVEIEVDEERLKKIEKLQSKGLLK